MIRKTAIFISAALLFLLPLYFLPFKNTPIDTDKQSLFSLLSLFLFLLLVVDIMIEKKVALKKTPFDLTLFFLAVSYIVSSLFFAPNLRMSIMSPMGTGTIVLGVLLFFTLTQILELKETGRIILPFLVSASLLAIVTLVSQFKLLPGIFPAGNSVSTLSVLVFAVVFFISSFISRQITADKKDAKLLPLLAFLLTLSAAMVTLYHILFDQKPLVLPFVFGWAIMMEVGKNILNFLFGIGPANFMLAYNLAKPIAINATPFWNFAPNASTNFPLTIATEAGFIAAVFFLLLSFRVVRLSTGSEVNRETKPILLGTIALLIIQFIYPTNIVIFAATLILLAAASPKTEVKRFTLPSHAVYICGILIILLAAIFYWQGKYYLADIYFRRALVSLNDKKLAVAYDLSQKAIATDPSFDKYYNLRGSLSLALAQNILSDKEASESVKRQAATQLTQQAVNDTQTATRLNRVSPGNWGQLASVYQVLIGSVSGAQQQAIDAYNQQIALDPNNPVPKVSEANLLMSLARSSQEATAAAGLLSSANTLLLQAINLKPDLNSARYNMSVLFRLTGRTEDAIAELQRSLDLTDPKSDDYKNLSQELDQLKKLLPEGTTGAQMKPPKK